MAKALKAKTSNHTTKMEEHPKLYNIAKQITLEAGLPWTDPRNGVTHLPKTKRYKKKGKQHERSKKTNL
jgi:hypothetical protein